MSDWLPVWDWTLKNISTLIAASALLPALLATLFAWRSSAIAKQAIEESKSLASQQLVHKILVTAYDLIGICKEIELEAGLYGADKNKISTFIGREYEKLSKSFIDDARDNALFSRTTIQKIIDSYEKETSETFIAKANGQSIREAVEIHSKLHAVAINLKFIRDILSNSRGDVRDVRKWVEKQQYELLKAKIQLEMAERTALGKSSDSVN